MYFFVTSDNIVRTRMKDDLLVYDITIDPAYSEDGKQLEIEQIAFVTQPAVSVKGFAFQAQEFFFKDDIKMRLAAPALIPMTIYRNDEFGEYYVRFSEEVIEELHMKMMKNLNNSSLFNTEHDPQAQAPAYLLEAWLVGKDPKRDRSYSEFGIEVPKGTLFVVAQVTDKAYYEELVKTGRTGFSVEGLLGMKLSEIINNKTKMADMKLPDGEHLISDKIYVVKDGEVVEIKEKPTEVGLAEAKAEEKEVEMAKEEVIEEVKKEEVKMQIDETELMTILQPKFEEIYAMIAELKNLLESEEDEEEEIEIPVEMSLTQRYQAAMKFTKDNY